MAIRLQEYTLYLRNDKKKKDGKMPLYIRFRKIGKKEPKFPLGLSLLPEEWDKDKERVNDASRNIILQSEISRVMSRIIDAEREGIEITIDMLREFVSQRQHIATKPENQSFYTSFNEYVSKRIKLGKMSDSTLKGYDSTHRALKEFRSEIIIKDISTKLLEDFDKFLNKRGLESGKGEVEGSRYNRKKHIRSVINFVKKKGTKIEDPFGRGDIVINEPPTNDVFLERKEFTKLRVYVYKNLKLGSTKMNSLLMFLFSCLTGLRIGDILSLKQKHLDCSSEPWIINKVLEKKVGGKESNLHIPISKVAMLVMNCVHDGEYSTDANQIYSLEGLVFPKIHPSTINKNLKEVAKMAGIKKNLTFHSARRTFATFMSGEDINNRTLMHFMGHTKFDTTLKYTKWNSNTARENAESMEIVKVKKKPTNPRLLKIAQSKGYIEKS